MTIQYLNVKTNKRLNMNSLGYNMNIPKVVVVHVVGGTCALIGAAMVGPRQGRFEKNSKIVKQNAVFQVLGK